VQAKTKGIWVWCLLHPTKPDYCLLLMDTEGLGDVAKVKFFTVSRMFLSE